MGAGCSTNNDNFVDKEFDTDEQNVRPTQAKKGSKPPRRAKHANSLVRIGSKIVRSVADPVSGQRQWTAARASTYDHVHTVVLTNFESSDILSRNAGVVGLRNMGNTCFMNSSLQCLINTIPLTDYFLGYDYRKEINYDNFLGTKGELVSCYSSLLKDMWLGKEKALEPCAFKKRLEEFAPQFSGGCQHDSQELLSFLLDGIHEDLNRVKKRPYIEDKDCDGTNDHGDAMIAWQNYLQRNRSIIVDVFQGQLRNEMICRNSNKKQPDGSAGCGHKNIKFEPFMYLSLPISDSSASLDDCLDLYCEEEWLTGDDRWYCPKCKEHVDASKKFDLWMLPPILIVHLKRFKYDNYGSRSKIETPLKYPVQSWDISRAVKSKGGVHPMYDLYAVSNHSGGLGCGHYTAFGMNRFDSEWYEFNDSSCRKLGPSSELGCSSSAYVLFYNRAERARDTTKVLRQSIDRPELWPHMQIMHDSYRDFKRSVVVSDMPSMKEDIKELQTVEE